jgi:nucleoside-diphosphate-sugar epimerase
MTTKHKDDNPILVTGAAGAVGGVGRTLTELLLAKGHKVRAMVRREDERAEVLRRLGAEVVKGDLTDLDHAAEFYAGSGNDRRRALVLARANVANRPTRRAIKQAHAIAVNAEGSNT